jgi:hypothetical protein
MEESVRKPPVVTNPTGEVGAYDVTITIKNPPLQVKPSSGSKI